MVFEVGIHGDSGHVTHITDSTVVVLFVFMFSVEGTHVHNSWVIRVGITEDGSSSGVSKLVRGHTKFEPVVTVELFQDGSGNAISHSESGTFTVLDRCFDPIVWNHIIVGKVDNIDDSNIENPHTEPTISIDGVFLEISVTFVVQRTWETVRGINLGIATKQGSIFVIVNIHLIQEFLSGIVDSHTKDPSLNSDPFISVFSNNTIDGS
mmetsp:Transcript_33310/g.30255  ORF Transcript_33310/g.30255 Transcript_33310/m.30255 type:complete len:208 (-) Transcript_33310:85-708(-)